MLTRAIFMKENFKKIFLNKMIKISISHVGLIRRYIKVGIQNNPSNSCYIERFKCEYLGRLMQKDFFFWNKTVSEKCCLRCDGAVFKSESVVETVLEENHCQTVKTFVCKKNSQGTLLLG